VVTTARAGVVLVVAVAVLILLDMVLVYHQELTVLTLSWSDAGGLGGCRPKVPCCGYLANPGVTSCALQSGSPCGLPPAGRDGRQKETPLLVVVVVAEEEEEVVMAKMLKGRC
jgi:hypothetical protein